MSTDFLSGFSELENKIEILLQSLETVKDENSILKQTADLNAARAAELEGRVAELENDKQVLESEIRSVKEKFEGEVNAAASERDAHKARADELAAALEEERGKVSAAAERVSGLLAKFNAVTGA